MRKETELKEVHKLIWIKNFIFPQEILSQILEVTETVRFGFSPYLPKRNFESNAFLLLMTW